MQDIEFKYLKGIIHKKQLENSNWCWAACLSKILIGFKISTQIGNKQCNIVSHYLRNYLHKTETKTNLCCKSSKIKNNCNTALAEEHLAMVFGDFGVKCTPIKPTEKHKLRDYNFISETINQTKAPIILQIGLGHASHLVLLSGYGHIGKCKYVLVGDPLKGAEFYKNIENYTEYEEISNIWTCHFQKDITRKISLVKDQLMFNNIMLFSNYMNTILKSNTNLKKESFNNNVFWMFQENTLLELLNNYNISYAPDRLNQKCEVFQDSCFLTVPREGFPNCLKPIIPFKTLNIDLSDKDKIDLTKDDSDEIYFTNYATLAKKRKNKKTKEEELKAIQFPSNYNLKKNEWLEEKAFMHKLKQNDEIKYFK